MGFVLSRGASFFFKAAGTDPMNAQDRHLLGRSEQLFAAFMDNLPGFAWIKDLEGRYTFANAMLLELEQYRPGWLGKTDAELWPTEIATALRVNDEAVIATRKPLQTIEPYLLAGQACYALVSKFPIFDSSGAVEMVGGSCIDITERLKAERAQAELAAIVDSSDDAIISKTLDGVIVSWNKSAEKIYGYSASEVIGRPITILIPSEQHDDIRKILERIKRGESIEHLGTTRLREDGTQISLSLTISPIKNNKGEITGASGVARDISAQKKAEQALRESERDQRLFNLATNDMFWKWDFATDQVVRSIGFERAFGYAAHEITPLIGWWEERLHPEDRERVLTAFQTALRSGDKTCSYEYYFRRYDGSYSAISDRAYIVRDESGKALRALGAMTDVTERKQTEEALHKANRLLRSLSRRRIRVQEDERRHLARELHYHIGQLLTAGTLNLQLARRTKDRRAINGKLDETIAIFEEILQQVRQISFDIRPPVLDDLGLAPAMRWMLDDTTARAGLTSEFFADPNLKRGDVESETACYRVGLEAVLNVIRHARARKVWLELRNAGDALELIVRDDGIGFDVAAAEKRAGRDRLGLVGMHERATALGGRFACKSAPGHGTEVRAGFPISSEVERAESL